jgi:Zn-dependent M28 family amino/carboxypeptidase
MTKLIGIMVIGGTLLSGADISGERIRDHVKFLAGDLLEGRGVGARGGDLATEYIATQFALAGLKPAGDNDTFFQRVPLINLTTDPGATLAASAAGREAALRWLDDFVGYAEEQKPDTRFDAEAIFVGHGIVAPEFQWNDYKGVDVKGKIVVLFTNEPASSDPKFFGGKALTYYGRWSYKYEEALRHGALACIIIHTTPTAGYGWEVVRNSWGHEKPFVRRAAGEPALAFAGWITSDAGNKLLGLAGHNVDELLKASESRDFRPIPLNVRLKANLPTRLHEIESRNVAGVVEGSDPKLKSEVVLFTSHWDHLGIGTPIDGDAIYNGAVDNATGCAALIEIARAWASLPQKPKRSALFLSVTAEEAGLLGSAYYADHPIFPPGKTALDINYDALYPFGRTSDVVVTGADRTTFFPQVEAIAKRMNLAILPDGHPEQGHYYRSDHFSLAHDGIPAFTVSEGTHYEGKPPDFYEKVFADYNDKHYHRPSDEYKEDWNFAGMEQMARFGFLLGIDAANVTKLPTWKPGDEFLPARQKSGVITSSSR